MSRICLFSIVLAALVGCQESPPPVFKTFGTITLNGKPVDGAMIVFQSDDPALKPATGRSDQLGNFKLTTNESADGAMAGTFKVRVTKIVAPPSPIGPYDPGFEEWAAEQEEARKRGEKTGLEPVNQLPEVYSTFDSSGLVFEVKAQDENMIEIKLEGEAVAAVADESDPQEQEPEENK